MNKRIDAILGMMKERNMFPGVHRYRYELNADDELTVIKAIGKARSQAFTIDEHCRFAYENIVKWCIGDNTAMAQDTTTKKPIAANMEKGWWIAGNTGSGKSWCLEIITAYCHAMRFQVDFGDSKGNLTWRNVRADDLVNQYMADGTMECRSYHILGIQDVGTEQQETVYMGNRMPLIRSFLEYRGDRHDQITMVTSNLPIEHPKITELYGDRVASRLNEMFNYVEIRGIDRRKK